MAGAGAESPVGVAESRANGKGPDEVIEKATAIEHKGGVGDEKVEQDELEISKGETGNEAEGEKSGVREGMEADESVLDEAVKSEGKANQVETPKKKRGKAQVLNSPSKGGESTAKESRKRKAREFTTTPSDRPSRERKSIERFVASSEKETSKEIAIEKGKGSLLRDIPNVAFKVSKRSRVDEHVKTLHKILYGRRVKASQLKNNILQFSGFLWAEDEEKQKLKLKDKLDKLNKDNLLAICDILDIHVIKTGSKKEEVVVRLIEFLEAPHVTTDVLLKEQIEKLKAKKRKKRSKGTPGKKAGKSSGKSPRKRQKKSVGSKEEIDRTEESEGDEDVEEENGEKESDIGEEEDTPGSEKEAEEEEEDDEDYGVAKKGSKSSTKKQSNKRKRNNKKNLESKGLESSPKKGLRSPKKGSNSKASSGSAVSNPKNSPTSKVFSRKTKKEKVEVNKPVSEGKKQGRKQANASANKSNMKEKDGKTKAKGKPDTSDPSDVELRSAISEILKGVDFNTATFTDIVKRLAGQFDMDFTERKGHVKVLIQEELSKLANEGDDGDDDEDQSTGAEGNAEKDESDDLTGQVVEAE
ncbi:hypothetical protein SUGI_0947080 [Cryptomeria japonica]|uniref:DEK domain-containing chromatin-associated protein 4 n=1 Tax=Cryptomeria japonica TaxID=3369 RepID=UPI0024147764|nr:DEK domain-containing chromatin-associated protein 4 [Cryptomeria japonica]GLJ44989.1 hypothetical protein SUGI_0947080 [Cryptomeria japonica]